MISLLPTANSAGYLNGLFQQERQIDDQGGGMEPVLLQLSVEYVDSGSTVQCRDGGFLKGPLGISGGDGDFGNSEVDDGIRGHRVGHLGIFGR